MAGHASSIDLSNNIHIQCGPGSVVGIATADGLDGPGIESGWVHTGPEVHPASCTMGTGSSPEVRCGGA